jgi:integrase
MKYVDKVGAYCYYRRGGKRWRLKGEPGSAQFLKDYARAENESRGAVYCGDDTFSAVIDAYQESPEFLALAQSTRDNYAIYLNKIRPVFGPSPIHDITRRHIRDFRRAVPKAGNQVVRVFKAVMAWAVDMDIIEVNQALGIKMVKGGEHKPWPDALIERFFRDAPPHLVWVVAIGLWTGQRRERVLSVRWADITDGVIHFKAHKGGNEVWVPVLPALSEVLETIPKRSLHILTTRAGRVWTPGGFGQAFRKYMRSIDAGDYVFHGLRKNFSVMAAEAGATVDELKSVTGHKSDAMAAHYTRRANRKRLAKSAILKIRGVNDD